MVVSTTSRQPSPRPRPALAKSADLQMTRVLRPQARGLSVDEFHRSNCHVVVKLLYDKSIGSQAAEGRLP